MKRQLSRAFLPPAPVIAVSVRAPDGVEKVTLDGKLDTGADVCAVPEWLVAELRLPPVRVVCAAGFGGRLVESIVYRVDVDIEQTTFARVEALTTLRPYAIIGRNVSAACVLQIDGPRNQLHLTLPAGAIRPRSKRRR